jgi:hypothetical protein
MAGQTVWIFSWKQNKSVGNGGEDMSSVKLNCPDGVIIAKEIKGYEDLYFATSNGQIWSCKRKQYLDQVPDQKGYLHVVLYKDGESKRCCVHRLVLSAFVPQPKDKDQVNHIDGNKQNNNLNNLEWVTNQENVQHAFKIGLEKAHYGEEHGMAKLTNEDVLTIRKLYAGGITDFNNKYSQRELAKMYGVKQSTIWGILHRKNWSHI